MSPMNRGEIGWINFEPSIGGEIQKQRPALIVSNDQSNQALNRLQVVPLTSNVQRLYSSEAYVTVRGRQSKALTHQLTTVSKTRLIDRVGRARDNEIANVERAIKVRLSLP
jgi:mRNA interferase MazF